MQSRRRVIGYWNPTKMRTKLRFRICWNERLNAVAVDVGILGLIRCDTVETAVQKWNNYKAGILRPDTILTVQDVKIIDTNSSNVIWAGKTEYLSARIQLNSYYLNNSSWNYNNRLKTVMHELGHALGLGENNYSLSTNVMKQGKSENITLTVDDKASYDLAYTYY